MDINAIAGLINQDLLRGNLFRVQIGGAPDIVNKMCCGVDFPGISYSFFLWRNAGPALKLPIEPTFDQVRMEFYCDAGGAVPQWIRKWNRDVMSEDWDMNFFDQYVKDVEIAEFNKQGSEVNKITLINAYPVTVEAVHLAFENTNVIEKIAIQLTYEYYKL